jgi:hypothetical protein
VKGQASRTCPFVSVAVVNGIESDTAFPAPVENLTIILTFVQVMFIMDLRAREFMRYRC